MAKFSAKAAGFSAVECHWPYEVPAEEVLRALQANDLPMLGLNSRRGDVDAGDAGLTAVPGREAEAIAAIDEAFDYGVRIGATAVHVMSGVAAGDDARQVLIKNLSHAATLAKTHDMTVLIEPINTRDIPGYYLNEVEQAVSVIEAVGSPAVKIMFDCYHVQIMQGDLLTRLKKHLAHVGHIQIAAVPDRGEPGQGELDYKEICKAIDSMGYDGYIGAEYKPRTTTDDGLGWLALM